MTAKEYYRSTRVVDTNNWTLEMALAFADEYAKAQKLDIDKSQKIVKKLNRVIEKFGIRRDETEREYGIALRQRGKSEKSCCYVADTKGAMAEAQFIHMELLKIIK